MVLKNQVTDVWRSVQERTNAELRGLDAKHAGSPATKRKFGPAMVVKNDDHTSQRKGPLNAAASDFMPKLFETGWLSKETFALPFRPGVSKNHILDGLQMCMGTLQEAVKTNQDFFHSFAPNTQRPLALRRNNVQHINQFDDLEKGPGADVVTQLAQEYYHSKEMERDVHDSLLERRNGWVNAVVVGRNTSAMLDFPKGTLKSDAFQPAIVPTLFGDGVSTRLAVMVADGDAANYQPKAVTEARELKRVLMVGLTR